MKKLIFVLACAFFLAPVLSSAAIVDFSGGTAGGGGTIVDLGAGEARGFDILIDHLFVNGTLADPDTAFGFTGFTMGFTPLAPIPCGAGLTCYQAVSTDFLNRSGFGAEAVPEPATLVLLGGGLLGLVRARKRNAAWRVVLQSERPSRSSLRGGRFLVTAPTRIAAPSSGPRERRGRPERGPRRARS